MTQKKPVHEMFLVHLLLCSPHPLGRALTDGAIEDVLDRVNGRLAVHPLNTLTPDAKAATLDLVAGLAPRRDFFKGIAEILKEGPYQGDEPHPGPSETERLINAMRQLDGN